MDTLEAGLLKLGLYSQKTIALLKKYIAEIELFNPAYGLVKVKDREELIVRHILDSLAPIDLIVRQINCIPGITGCAPGVSDEKRQIPPAKIADLGTGAGLPGIPLAIFMPQGSFTLVERMGRRAGFLRNTLALLSLPNVVIEESEAERIALTNAGNFNAIIFRAFKPLEVALLKRLQRLLSPGGFLAAYKGRRQSIDDELERLWAEDSKLHELLRCECMSLEVPFLKEERHLLILSVPPTTPP